MDGNKEVAILRADEVASILGIAERTTYRLAEKGVLPALRITENCIRFRSDQIQKFLDSCELNK